MDLFEKLGLQDWDNDKKAMFNILVEWCLSAETIGGPRNPKYIISKNIIASATNKTWDEIKELL